MWSGLTAAFVSGSLLNSPRFSTNGDGVFLSLKTGKSKNSRWSIKVANVLRWEISLEIDSLLGTLMATFLLRRCRIFRERVLSTKLKNEVTEDDLQPQNDQNSSKPTHRSINTHYICPRPINQSINHWLNQSINDSINQSNERRSTTTLKESGKKFQSRGWTHL